MAGAPYSVRVHYWLRWSPQVYSDALVCAGVRPKRRAGRSGWNRIPNRRARRRVPSVLVAVTALALLWAAGSTLTSFFGLHEPQGFSQEASLSLFQEEPLRYDLWYSRDLAHLKGLSDLPAAFRRAQLEREFRDLGQELARIDQESAYVDPRGFRVYGPAATGRLQALALARDHRRALLAGTSPDRLPGPDAVHTYGGYPLYRSLPRKFSPTDEVIRALQGIRLPDEALAGYRVYLLPGSLGNMSGFGGHGYAMLSGEPLTERLVDHQAASTAVHEFGHHLSLSRLGGHLDESPAEWRRYLKLRGIPEWRNDGEVNTEAWARSPEEALAEDFRVLFGPPEAASLPYDAGYGDPRQDAALRREVEAFLEELSARKERQPADASPAPWVDDLGAGLRAGAAPAPFRISFPQLGARQVLLAVALLSAAAGLASIRSSVRLARQRA